MDNTFYFTILAHQHSSGFYKSGPMMTITAIKKCKVKSKNSSFHLSLAKNLYFNTRITDTNNFGLMVTFNILQTYT